MSTPRRLVIPNDCLDCTLRKNGDFCHLPGPALHSLNSVGHITWYPANATLFREGETLQGVYIVCSGRVKLSLETPEGKTVILKIASDREVLGMSAVLAGRSAPVSVTTVDFCQISFVEQSRFLHLVATEPDVSVACAHELARKVNETFADVHELLLARSSTEKLARLLLSWVANEPRNRDLRVAAEFTHEEIAQMIGSSRETVTRLMSDMKRRELIRIEGSTLVIPNRVALQAIM
ncbi:MAG TPA: Crp/Fnr family transcriptional regulator [Terriglobales bacterium]|nr:Crp/Fnr family transcriptional regulator [Terriglobales bacterium]